MIRANTNLLVAAILFASCLAVSGSDISEWESDYKKLFERDGLKTRLEEEEVMTLLTSLKKNSASLKHVDSEKLKHLNFWYDTITDTNPESQCTHSYWQDLSDAYYDDLESDGDEGDAIGLLELARKNLLNACKDKYAGLSEILDTLVGDSLEEVKKIHDLYRGMSTDERFDSKKLIALVRKLTNQSRLSGKGKLRKAWQSSACSKVLSKMQEPGMSKYEAFAHLGSEAGGSYLSYFPAQLRFWVQVFEMCNDLDSAVEDY